MSHTRPCSHARATVSFWCLAWFLPAIGGETPPLQPPFTLCDVIAVRDGDTVRLDCGGGPFKARIECIDAPEIAQDPWGHKARANLNRILGVTVWTLEVGRYLYGGPMLRLIDPATGTNLGLRQVADGWAAFYGDYCKDPAYQAAEADARQHGLGVWQAPGNHQQPWRYRKEQRQRSGQR